MNSLGNLVRRYAIEIQAVDAVQAVDPFARRSYKSVRVVLTRGTRRVSLTVFHRYPGAMTSTRAVKLAVRDLLKSETEIDRYHKQRPFIRDYVTETEDALLSLVGEDRLRRLKQRYTVIQEEWEDLVYDSYMDER